MVYHPVKEKNRSLLNNFEAFVRSQEAVNGISQDNKLVYARYNGINEGKRFKSPQKLPTLLYFKRNEDGLTKEVHEFQDVNSLLVKRASEEEIQ